MVHQSRAQQYQRSGSCKHEVHEKLITDKQLQQLQF